MSRTRMLSVAAVSLMSIVLVLSVLSASVAAENRKHAVLTVSAWSGDFLPAYVPKILMEDKLGYTTELVDLSVPALCAALGAGEADLCTLLWMPNNQPLIGKYVEKGTVESLGVIYPECPQGVFVPKWIYEQKGIRSISDLNDPEFAKMFDINNDGKGDWLGCDPGWICAKMNEDCIALYGLDKLYVQMVGDANFLTAAMIGKMKKNEPILVYQFYPHQMFIDYPRGKSLILLDDPKGFWFSSYVEKFANKNWVAENPEAAEIVRQVEMTTEDVMWMMKQVRDKGDDPETLDALAREWMAKNQAAVDSWLTAIK